MGWFDKKEKNSLALHRASDDKHEAAYFAAINKIEPKFTNFCFSSEFAPLGLGTPLRHRRYIEQTINGWNYVDYETRLNTSTDGDPKNYLQETGTYNTLDQGLSFGMALHQLHQFEMGSILLKDEKYTPSPEQFPDYYHYQHVIQREGLIFDTQHHLHGSKNGRPVLTYPKAVFLQKDLATLATAHYKPDPNNFKKIIEVTDSMQILQKMGDFKSQTAALRSNALRLDSIMKNDSRLYYESLICTKFSEELRKFSKTDPNLNKQNLYYCAQIIEWLGEISNISFQNTDGEFNSATQKSLKKTFSSWENNSLFTPQIKDFFTHMVVYPTTEKHVKEYIASITTKWIEKLDNPPASSNDHKKDKKKDNDGGNKPSITVALQNNMHDIFSPLNSTMGQIVTATNEASRNASTAENVYHALYTKKNNL